MQGTDDSQVKGDLHNTEVRYGRGPGQHKTSM
jgi:hypothetical protein